MDNDNIYQIYGKIITLLQIIKLTILTHVFSGDGIGCIVL